MKNREWLEFIKEENYLFGEADTPKTIKERLANLFGKGRPSTIKRTRKRGIERARWMGMTQLEKRRVSMMRRIVKVFASVNGYRR